MQSKGEWNNSCGDCCGQPGGCGLFIYTCLCPCCAAGDVAKHANRDYCMSCCVMPMLGCQGCWWCQDRKALAEKYRVHDPFEGCTSCCMFYIGCHSCMLIQQLNHIKAVQLQGGLQRTNPVVPVQQQMSR